MIKDIIMWASDIAILPILTTSAIYGRYAKKKYDVGIGSMPLINTPNHKKSLELYGHKTQSFVGYTWFQTQDFDIVFCRKSNPHFIDRLFSTYKAMIHATLNYKVVFTYINGILTINTPITSKLEPYLLKLSRTKAVVLQYGSDVQVFEHSANLLFKHMACQDYGRKYNNISVTKKNIMKWSKHADYLLTGEDWIEFLPYWDEVISAHFAFDVKNTPIPKINTKPKEYVVLHAPNHRNIKGTQVFIEAVDKLKTKGYPIRIEVIEKKSNAEVLNSIERCFLVADQLTLGWYAMLAVEGMAYGKPVLCYIRQDFLDFYEKIGVLSEGELPLVQCTHNPDVVAKVIEELILNEEKYREVSRKSREFVNKHHSIEHIGSVFDRIYKEVVKEC